MNILCLVFFGLFIGVIVWLVGGVIFDKFGGVWVMLINFIFMVIFSVLLFFILLGIGFGNFIVFYVVFMGLFLIVGLGSGFIF